MAPALLARVGQDLREVEVRALLVAADGRELLGQGRIGPVEVEPARWGHDVRGGGLVARRLQRRGDSDMAAGGLLARAQA
jgi:hypothetical protein